MTNNLKGKVALVTGVRVAEQADAAQVTHLVNLIHVTLGQLEIWSTTPEPMSQASPVMPRGYPMSAATGLLGFLIRARLY